jgi:hypothetical protein
MEASFGINLPSVFDLVQEANNITVAATSKLRK